MAEARDPRDVAAEAAAAERRVLRELTRGWRRWRALLLVKSARDLRLIAAGSVGERSCVRRGFMALLVHAVARASLVQSPSGSLGSSASSNVASSTARLVHNFREVEWQAREAGAADVGALSFIERLT